MVWIRPVITSVIIITKRRIKFNLITPPRQERGQKHPEVIIQPRRTIFFLLEGLFGRDLLCGCSTLVFQTVSGLSEPNWRPRIPGVKWPVMPQLSEFRVPGSGSSWKGRTPRMTSAKWWITQSCMKLDIVSGISTFLSILSKLFSCRWDSFSMQHNGQNYLFHLRSI